MTMYLPIETEYFLVNQLQSHYTELDPEKNFQPSGRLSSIKLDLGDYNLPFSRKLTLPSAVGFLLLPSSKSGDGLS